MKDDISNASYKTMKKIKEAYYQLCFDSGNLDKIPSIINICEKANINRCTFYLHYKSIEELIEDTCNDLKKLLFNDRIKNMECLDYFTTFFANLKTIDEKRAFVYSSNRYGYLMDEFKIFMINKIYDILPEEIKNHKYINIKLEVETDGLFRQYRKIIFHESKITLDELEYFTLNTINYFIDNKNRKSNSKSNILEM